MKQKFKLFNIALAVGLIFSMLLSMVGFDACCQDLRDNVFRLHIIAASDSERDQQLKLSVRDSLLCESEELFLGADSLEDAILLTKENLPKIEKIAEETLSSQGCDYDVRVSVEPSFFDTRVYDDFTLPAGEYEALRVEIGPAKGKNWWCVLFPGICVGACGDLGDTAGKGGTEIAYGAEKFEVRFKIVEVYEQLKLKISSLL